MTLKENKLFGLIAISLSVLIAVPIGYYIAFPYIYHVEPQQTATTILGILIAIFVLFFASTQILYSVSDVPRKLLIKYSIRAKESKSLIAYFFIAILFCGSVTYHQPVPYTPYLLFFTLLLSLLIITCYFFWLTKRITPEEIIKQITLEAGTAIEKINEFEQARQKHYVSFHEFVAGSEGKYRYELKYYLVEGLLNSKYPGFTLEAKEQKDSTISEIKVKEIEQKLIKISAEPHIKIIFEVEPTLIIPIKNPYERMLDNYRLLTIVFEQERGESQAKYQNAQEDFIRNIEGNKFKIPENVSDKSKYLAEKVSQILTQYGEPLTECFEQKEHKKWTRKVDVALDSLKSMFEYHLRNEEALDHLCTGLEEIVLDRFFGGGSGVFLGLRSNYLRKIGEMFKDINEASLRRDDTTFIERMLRLFYRLVLTKKQPINRAIYDEALYAIRYFHSLFVTTAPHAYNFGVEILVLNIIELVPLSIKKRFEEEIDLSLIDTFYKPVLENGVDTAFKIVEDYIHWYNEDRSHNQIYLNMQMQHLINFIPHYKDTPVEYFSNQYEYYKTERDLEDSVSLPKKKREAFRLAEKKAEMVNDLTKQLQMRIMQLSIDMLKRYMDKELDADVIWKIAMPAAENSCYEHGLEDFFTARFNDFQWRRQAQDLFSVPTRWARIASARAHGFNLCIFWIIFNVYLGRESFFPLNAKELLRNELLQSFKFIDANFWAKALNMKLKEFKDRIKQYESFANEIKLKDKDKTQIEV